MFYKVWSSPKKSFPCKIATYLYGCVCVYVCVYFYSAMCIHIIYTHLHAYISTTKRWPKIIAIRLITVLSAFRNNHMM